MKSTTPENQIIDWLRQPGIKPYLFAALSTLLVLMHPSINPFGLVKLTDTGSALAFSTVVSPFHGGSQTTGQDDILVIESATFNDNLNYLLSMGTKSMNEILKQSSDNSLIPFVEWQQQSSARI